jgi:multiple sugar transport system ATP-binding protein
VRTTTVYVTHDQVEAMTLADRVVVMNQGRIEQVGAPNDLYHSPRTQFVAGFIGSPAMNFLPARLEDNAGKLQVRLTDTLALPVPDARAARYRSRTKGEALTLGIRPEHITETRADVPPGVAPLEAKPDVIEPMGMETLVYFRIGESDVCGRVNPNAAARVGENFRMAVDLNHMHLIDPATGLVI